MIDGYIIPYTIHKALSAAPASEARNAINSTASSMIDPHKENNQDIDPYKVECRFNTLDPYVIDHLFGPFPAPVFQALKKLLRFGRKHKSQRRDVEEAISSLQRWLEINEEPPTKEDPLTKNYKN